MAFFRFNRDKRGYEHFYLVEPVTNRRGKSRTRVLYWYRTPPNVRVGRAPFDEEVQRALEAQNPNVAFDWRKIIDAPIPSADVEKWRERRRAERAEKTARKMTAAAEEPLNDIADRPSPMADDLEPAPPDDDAAMPESVATESTASTAAVTMGGSADSIRKRRRRRRGRGPRPESTHAVAGALVDGLVQEPVRDARPAASADQAAPVEAIETPNPTETLGD